jgi:hypothetical protein
MFIPNSPSPPRGIAVSVCVGLLKKSGSPVSNLKSYHTAKLALLFLALPPSASFAAPRSLSWRSLSLRILPGFALVYNSQRNVFGASYLPARHFPWPRQIRRNSLREPSYLYLGRINSEAYFRSVGCRRLRCARTFLCRLCPGPAALSGRQGQSPAALRIHQERCP